MGQGAESAQWRSVWIDQGRDHGELPSTGGAASEDMAIHRKGLVKVTFCKEPAPCELDRVLAELGVALLRDGVHSPLSGAVPSSILPGRLVQRDHRGRAQARDRIHALIAKSDVHLLARTYLKEADPDPRKMPPLLQDAWGDRAVKPDYSIDCVHDDSDDRFKVMRIGPGSPIARLWGIFPVSYPCLMGNPYDQIVSEVYPQVVKTGEPHYGHVYAAMSLPNRQVRWVPYQRVVLPHRFPDGRRGVTVISELTPVDIQVV
jgi:hypothetical protein